MISHLSGKLILERAGFVIVDVNGVGYKVHTAAKLVEEKCDLFIHEHIREDSDDLFGFLSFDDLELFEKLISVNGVGPKAAMAIMSSAASDRIIDSIIKEDLTFFQAVPGIGKKVAAKIIIELKSKMSGLSGTEVVNKLDEGDEIIEALESLGYKKAEIAKRLSSMPVGLESIEAKVRWFLKQSAK